jgi:DNA-binding NtrC family response regulator
MKQRKFKVLIIDDNDAYLGSLTTHVRDMLGFDVIPMVSGEDAFDELGDEGISTIDVAIVDYNLPGGMNGIEIGKKLYEINSKIFSVLLSADVSDKEINIAYDNNFFYVARKSDDDKETLNVIFNMAKAHFQRFNENIENVLYHLRQRARKRQIFEYEHGVALNPFDDDDFEVKVKFNLDDKVIGEHEVLKLIKRRFIPNYGKSDDVILISGDNGTGKELIAKTIHSVNFKDESNFLVIHCGSLVSDAAFVELFGTEYYDATGRKINRKGKLENLEKGGTLYLDEIGDLNDSAQTRFLRLFQERAFNRMSGGEKINLHRVKIVCSTSKNISELIAKDTFKKGLYHSISGFFPRLPNLSEIAENNPEDFKALVNHFCSDMDEDIFTESAIDKLVRHNWEGNIRELRQFIQFVKTIFQDKIPITLQRLHAILNYWEQRGATANATAFSEKEPSNTEGGVKQKGNKLWSINEKEKELEWYKSTVEFLDDLLLCIDEARGISKKGKPTQTQVGTLMIQKFREKHFPNAKSENYQNIYDKLRTDTCLRVLKDIYKENTIKYEPITTLFETQTAEIFK